ncbi:TPA: gp58-like family protein [Streptococcus pyogenes]|uniref:gp58-like family protein n=1 Tax=Streptococcus pyogenes TaxID=1314 RepID=UPI00109C7608|nr:gp58-like family protein [Streptococcus pyogenes]VHE55489.1 Phage infection protein [Streptococcus pyogenes]VHG80729.1 Phage infection protein [Streptococcus pyogenes]VHN07364.1 Phage infection protein [Streptococcus pyogenes]HEP1537667.1 gp58-like family protein [Streptococcus pyogenes]
MSRDPTLLIDESNLTIGSDGRAYYTFTADDNTKSVKIANNKCIGTTRFNQLMIERGNKPTNYVAPVVVEGTGNPTGLFKDLKELNLELTDTANSQLWAKIKLNNHGMLQTYFDTTIKNEILTTAQGIRETISDTERGLKSEFLKTVQGQRIQLESLLEQKTAQLGLTVDGLRLELGKAGKQTASLQASIEGLRQDYQDADRQLSSTYQTGINGLKATMANDKYDLKAEIQATARGLSQEYDNKLHQLSAKIKTTSSGTTEAYENKLNSLRAEFTRSHQGMRTVLESKISGLQSTQQTTANQIAQEIRNRDGAVSRLQQIVEGIQSTVSAPNRGLESRVTQLAGLIEQKVTRGEMESYIRGAGDSIMLAIKGKLPQSKMSAKEIVSAINLNGYGVRISGERIALDGNTTVNGAFGAKLGEFIKLRADNIIGGTIDANKINVINLKASSIRGLDAEFIKARIEHTITSLLEGKVIRARNGAMMIDLNNSTIDFNSDASINFNSNNNALVRKSGTHTAFVHFSNATPKNFAGSALYASIGITSSGDRINSASSGRFCGARFFRTASGYEHTASIDQAEIYGDTVYLSDDFNINRGFRFRPAMMPGLLDMNDLYSAIIALGRCWQHLANANWNTARSNFINAVNSELNNHITKI